MQNVFGVKKIKLKKNDENKEETIMRCVYKYYTEYLYKKIPTQYNINTDGSSTCSLHR